MKRSSMDPNKMNKIMNVVAVVLVLATFAALFFFKDISSPGRMPDAGAAKTEKPEAAADHSVLSGDTSDTSSQGVQATDISSFSDRRSVIPSAAWSRDIAAKGYKDGAPIGGLGAGTITWRYDGNFYDGRLVIGSNNMDINSACGFYMYQKPAKGRESSFRLDAASLGSGQAEYYSLFPKSWVDYHGDKFICKAKVTQFSPLIPGDYELSSYPAGVYIWELSNPTQERCDVSIMLIWKNNYGGRAVVPVKDDDGRFSGIKLAVSGTAAFSETKDSGAVMDANTCEFSIGCVKADGMEITYTSSKDINAIQKDFGDDGMLNNAAGNDQTGALCITVSLEPGEKTSFPMALTWDMPVFKGEAGNDWYRKYTRFFGRDGENSWEIALEALRNAVQWENMIDSWQNTILVDPKYPDWLKTTLFNELYYYTVGGTVWEAGAASGQPDDPDEDMFSSLECFEYPFYGTSDVRFYGSWALVQLWPEIDKQCVKQFCDSVYNTRSDRPKAIGTTAHDFGMGGMVFAQWNGYTYRDSTNWRDLNTKLVLMVYRDWALTGKTDKDFLDYCWIPVQKAMDVAMSHDADGDGLPDSHGVDQTYDNLSLTGDTAYCGGLFLAACQAAEEIAREMGDVKKADEYREWFEKGKKSFEDQLWNGSYYNIDTGSSDPKRIMSDQLCGQWYSIACGLPGIVSDEHAVSALNVVYENNFRKFDKGAHGIVNVMKPNGRQDTSSGQAQECWVGTSWSVAAGMLQQGMKQQAEEIGQSLYNTIWDEGQLWFRTPEAWFKGINWVRAEYYMRATAVWALKHAYDISER
jgi:non-lysosomal glucosylceramidase